MTFNLKNRLKILKNWFFGQKIFACGAYSGGGSLT